MPPAWSAVLGSWVVAITIALKVVAGCTATAVFWSHTIAHTFTPRPSFNITDTGQPYQKMVRPDAAFPANDLSTAFM